MLMLTWWEGGVHEKITDYVDMGRGLQKFDLYCFKKRYAIHFQTKCFYF